MINKRLAGIKPIGRMFGESAIESNLFTEKEIEQINHLNSNNPTAKDAADYIDLLINKLENLK